MDLGAGMLRLADGFASLIAALVAVAITLPPAWFTHRAVQAAAAPGWAYVPAVGLAAVGLILGLAFGRKAARGVAPSRDRPR
jgi:hypothetical protein